MIYTYIVISSFSVHSNFSLQVFYDCYVFIVRENDDRSCYDNLMEDINNFKILNQKMKTRSLLYQIKDEINNCRKLFIESAHKKRLLSNSFSCYFKNFWLSRFMFCLMSQYFYLVIIHSKQPQRALLNQDKIKFFFYQ